MVGAETRGAAYRFGRALRALFEPPQHISDVGERRGAQLVAVVSAALFFLTLFGQLLNLAVDPRSSWTRFPIVATLLCVHAATFALNRTRSFRLAAFILCLGPIWSNVAVGLADAADPLWYAFLPASTLFASVLLPFRGALAIACLGALVSGAVVAVHHASISRERALLIPVFVVIFNVILLAIARFRAWVEAGRRAELQALERHLAETQRMEALGRLAAGVAHDFNNFLTVIRGDVELARRPSAGSALDEIEMATDRAAELVSQLLAFARQHPSKPVSLRLDDVIRNLEPILKRLAGAQVSLSFSLAARWPIDADPVQLEQIMLNLVANARDALPRGGTIEVVTRSETVGEEGPVSLPRGDYVVLAVRDDGVGMDAATLERAFDPFFTTKPSGQGTGLGLATVRNIVASAGGAVEAQSGVGHGTTLRLYLPRSPADAQTTSASLLASAAPR